jgi:hypothetical protein
MRSIVLGARLIGFARTPPSGAKWIAMTLDSRGPLQKMWPLCRQGGNWLEAGLIEPVAGRRREFAEDQIERVRLIKELQKKGIELAQLAGRNLAFQQRKVRHFRWARAARLPGRRNGDRHRGACETVLCGRSGHDPQGFDGVARAAAGQVGQATPDPDAAQQAPTFSAPRLPAH